MIKSSSNSCEIHPWVIFHIPHDSTVIPSEVRDQFVLNELDLSRELIKMTDHNTYDLIARIFPTSQIVKFPVSRLVVDVERFESDCDEHMAARGMGVDPCYLKNESIYFRSGTGRTMHCSQVPWIRH